MKDRDAKRPKDPDRTGVGARIWFAFLAFVMTMVGLVAVTNATYDLGYASGLRGSAVRMEISFCSTTGTGKAARTTCYGDPVGSSNDGLPRLSVPGGHQPHAVLDADCDARGRCREAGVGAAAGDLALICVGLFFLSGAVAGGTVLVQSFRPGRPGGAGPRPGLKRALKLWFSGLGVLLVLSGIVAIVS